MGEQRLKRTAICLGLAWLVLAGALAQTPPSHHHDFAGAEHWAKIFDDPARDDWQRPHQVIQALALAPDAVVADIGAGTGYFTVRIARMIPAGHVVAEDVEPEMIKYVSQRIKRESLPNVTPLLGQPDDPRLPVPVDLVLVVDTYHHIDGRQAYFRRLQGHLKPAGEVAIIDFTKDSPIGPPPSERLAADDVKKEMAQAGYALAAEHAFLPDQYFLIFRRAAAGR
jgi:SAM-dependent methyltransferase